MAGECMEAAWRARSQPRRQNTAPRCNSRLLVVDGEADEVPVVGGPVPVPRDDDAVLPRGGGREVQDVTFTWGTEAHCE